MDEYEIVFIARTEMEQDAFNALVEQAQGWLTDGGGEVLETDIWGTRKLAYSIAKQKEGVYVFMRATMPPAHVKSVDQRFRIAEPVLRHLIVRAPKVQ